MSAVERLAAAHQAWMDDFTMPNRFVDGMFVADPHLAQDLADGEALRRLREALPAGWDMTLRTFFGHWGVEVWDPRYPTSHDEPPQPRYLHFGTIAAAADKCREAIEAQR